MFLRISLLFSFAFFSIMSWAQEQVPPNTMEEAMKYIGQLITAIGNGDFKVIGGVVLMVGMVAVRQYLVPKWKLTADQFRLAMAAITALAFAGLAMTNEGVDIGPALKTAFITSGVAALIWDLAGQYLFKLIGVEPAPTAVKLDFNK